MVRLFSYATLRQTEVQRSTFGRELSGAADYLLGFEVRSLEISDPKIVALSGASVPSDPFRSSDPIAEAPGVVFTPWDDELRAGDAYEAADD